MKTANFASLRVVVPKWDYATNKPSGVDLVVVGMAQSLRISDSFGTRPQNIIGTPFPIMAPGFMSSTISIEKCIIDGASFRNLGAFNPLWAHVGAVYDNPISLGKPEDGFPNNGGADAIFPFMFILAVKDKISDDYTEGHVPIVGADSTKMGSNPFGTYACVMTDANISLSSQQSVIMDSVNAIARPMTGTWLSKAVTTALQSQGRNGMDDEVNGPMFGYRNSNKPKKK